MDIAGYCNPAWWANSQLNATCFGNHRRKLASSEASPLALQLAAL